MKTKFILAGGYMSSAPDGGKAYLEAIVGNRETAQILICPFAAEEEHWVRNFDHFRKKLETAYPNRVLTFEMAHPSQFGDQIDRADVIVYLGGHSSTLMEQLWLIPDWMDRDLSGKTVVGSSAGAYMLSAAFVKTSEEPELTGGLSFLPCITVVHYRKVRETDEDNQDPRTEYWDGVDALMEASSRSFDIFKLREGEFVVINS